MAPAYRWHRLFLQHLQSRHPAPRWVLKSPGHLWCLGALLDEYPNALLVQTHRDPLRIIASLSVADERAAPARRATTSRSPRSRAEFAELPRRRTRPFGRPRARTARCRADRVVDVQFRAFMADPFATIRAIYDRLGLELAPTAEQRMRAFLADNPTEKHGGHHYTFADTGLDIGEWRERTRRYQEYFDVPTENLD